MTAFDQAWAVVKTYKIQDWRTDNPKSEAVPMKCKKCNVKMDPDTGLCGCGE